MIWRKKLGPLVHWLIGLRYMAALTLKGTFPESEDSRGPAGDPIVTTCLLLK